MTSSDRAVDHHAELIKEMNVPLFDPATAVEKKRQLRTLGCDVPGPLYGAWRPWWTADHNIKRRPRCTRTTGHDGPHREYDKKARIRAEWRNRT